MPEPLGLLLLLLLLTRATCVRHYYTHSILSTSVSPLLSSWNTDSAPGQTACTSDGTSSIFGPQHLTLNYFRTLQYTVALFFFPSTGLLLWKIRICRKGKSGRERDPLQSYPEVLTQLGARLSSLHCSLRSTAPVTEHRWGSHWKMTHQRLFYLNTHTAGDSSLCVQGYVFAGAWAYAVGV